MSRKSMDLFIRKLYTALQSSKSGTKVLIPHHKQKPQAQHLRFMLKSAINSIVVSRDGLRKDLTPNPSPNGEGNRYRYTSRRCLIR